MSDRPVVRDLARRGFPPAIFDPLPRTVAEPEPADPLELWSGRDILVVEDQPMNLAAIEAALSALGRTLVTVVSGVAALDKLREQDFALIVLDVVMPGLDGFEIARRIRARERNRATPIICVTGMAWHDDAVLRGYQLGTLDVVIQPVRAEVLHAKAMVFLQLQDRTLELRDKADELREAQARAHERELVAQRRRFEAEVMAHEMKQLAEADRRKDEFLAILAHELRNPLQPLQTAVEVLAHEPDKPVPPKIRDIVRRQVEHITRLVDDLLDVARFSEGRIDLRRAPIAIAQIVDEAVASCQDAIFGRRHTLTIVGGDPTAKLDGDAIRLIQVVSNLLHNAATYTEPGGRLTVRWGADGRRGFVQVGDNGKGISPQLLPKIFDMFVPERATPDGGGGLGLGLGLVRLLVELHGGTVTATSRGPGRGSTFEIRIPLAPTSPPPPEPGALDLAPATRPLRAVVCDDAADLCELVADLLRLRGHDVSVVADGLAAVQRVCEQRPDVALIDIGLPEMDGYEVARRITRELGAARPRLIAMTGYGLASDRARAFAAGFDAHLVKPASADKILRALYGGADEPVS